MSAQVPPSAPPLAPTAQQWIRGKSFVATTIGPRALVVLSKLRVVVLLMAAAMGGALLGTDGHPFGPGTILSDSFWPGYNMARLLNNRLLDRRQREVALALFELSNVYLGAVLITLMISTIWR